MFTTRFLSTLAQTALWTVAATIIWYLVGKTVSKGPWSSSKAQTYLFDLFFHTTTTIIGVTAFFHLPTTLSLLQLLDVYSPWWWEGIDTGGVLNANLVYVLQQIVYANAGYYVFSFLLVAFTTRRTDMLLHHFFSTLMSVIGAYSRSFLPAVVVVVSHNVSDIFLLVGKLCKMRQTKSFLLLSDLSFYVFVAFWMPTRVYFIPRYLAWSIAVNNATRLSEPIYSALCVVIVVIQTLHFYWSAMIVRLAYRKLTSNSSSSTQTDDDYD